MTNTFQTRAEAVSERLADLGLGHIEVPNLDELLSADTSVEEYVSRVRDAETAPDIDDLAVDIVSGKLKPETAVKRLSSAASLKNAGGRSRLDQLVAATRRAAVAHVDRPELSVAALRRSVVPEIRTRLEATAAEMLNTMNAAPATVLGHLTAVVETGHGILYGPAPSDQVGGSLQFLSPDGDLSKVRGSDLAATQALIAAWRWVNTDPAQLFGAFWYLSTGQSLQRTYTNEFTGAGADEAENFRPEYLLVSGEAVDYVAAGIKLPFLVAAGYIETFDVLADPFGDDKDAYAERVERAQDFLRWRDAARRANNAGAGHLMSREQLAKMQARSRGSKLSQVQWFRTGDEQ
ncbi:MAG: hypothetical protein ACI38U_00270 [Corynebacterium sp.]|uniref:hypothetical protein n=1 Tax=Corynebacterium sp. TaxID=1720 RepID=UPI003F107067